MVPACVSECQARAWGARGCLVLSFATTPQRFSAEIPRWDLSVRCPACGMASFVDLG